MNNSGFIFDNKGIATGDTHHSTHNFHLLLLAVAFCLLNSCGGENIPLSTLGNGMSIGFNAEAKDPVARASDIGQTALKTTGFTVLAFSTGSEDWATTKMTVTPDFMYKQAMTWNNTTSKWEYTPVKYWPGKVDNTNYGKVTFFAYAPTTANPTVSAKTANGAPTITYTLPNSSTDQLDLLADVLADKTYSGGTVKLIFNHLLSRIDFKAQLAAQYNGATVKMTHLQVNYTADKIKNAGIYTFGDADHAAGSWSLTAAGTSAMSGNGGEMITTPPTIVDDSAVMINDNTKYLMLMPQQAEAGDLQVEVTWTVTTGTGTGEYTVTNSQTISLPAVTWEQGKSYTYKFNVSLAAVELDDDIDVTGWNDISEYRECTVTYMANNGTDARIVKYGWKDNNLVFAANPFTPPAGKTFTEWNTAADGTGTSYAPDSSAKLTGNLTLYAQWI
ncbi:MAG: fimbrillin family protein [Mediterranea sp.]|nr:fimbrillin family protein [Mediterranea sp.]